MMPANEPARPLTTSPETTTNRSAEIMIYKANKHQGKTKIPDHNKLDTFRFAQFRFVKLLLDLFPGLHHRHPTLRDLLLLAHDASGNLLGFGGLLMLD